MKSNVRKSIRPGCLADFNVVNLKSLYPIRPKGQSWYAFSEHLYQMLSRKLSILKRRCGLAAVVRVYQKSSKSTCRNLLADRPKTSSDFIVPLVLFLVNPEADDQQHRDTILKIIFMFLIKIHADVIAPPALWAGGAHMSSVPLAPSDFKK